MNQPRLTATLSLFEDNDLSVPNGQTSKDPKPRLALNMDHREWLSLLAEAWWPIKSAETVLQLGVNIALSNGEAPIDIVAWVDPEQLPEIHISVLREDSWVKALPRQIRMTDRQIIWPGPIPLFAVSHFSVLTHERQEHIAAMAQSFANISLPEQEIRVEEMISTPALLGKNPKQTLAVPESWNALRGAAAMATWGVPTISPWLEILGLMLSKPSKPSRPRKLPDTDTPWLLDTPWRYLTTGPAQKTSERSVILWRAMLNTFANVKIRDAWHPQEILEQVCDDARRQGLDPESLDSLLLKTSSILDDREAIDATLVESDPMGFILQLVLLRPKPEQFTSWRSELPPLPPVVYWSGAILSGLVQGYRNLERRFRSDAACQRLLDLKTWSCVTRKKVPWPNLPAEQLELYVEDNIASLRSGDSTWISRKLGRRGLWYVANLETTANKAKAIEIAAQECPQALSKAIQLPLGKTRLLGSGRVTVSKHQKGRDTQLLVKGNVHISLDDRTPVLTLLNETLFKRWVSTAALGQKLPYPPEYTAPQKIVPPESAQKAPDGLNIVSDFLTEEQERTLVQIVNFAPWSSELKRRVQHYGWKYDYKARDIRDSSYLGPLPEWAAQLAQRLHRDGLMPEIADQVIVNEYILNQGINKHIDCIDCFKGPVVTISLLESWHMQFTRKDSKIEVLLPQRSATIIDGPARYEWTHEIPQRKYEGLLKRARRISITFRKVISPSATSAKC